MKKLLILMVACAGLAVFSVKAQTVYEYTYPTPAQNLNENQQIVLSQTSSGWVGYFHGTSDEFMDAREGFLPGFFVLPMLELTMDKGSLSFSLKPGPEDIFTKPIPLNCKTSAEAKKLDFEK